MYIKDKNGKYLNGICLNHMNNGLDFVFGEKETANQYFGNDAISILYVLHNYYDNNISNETTPEDQDPNLYFIQNNSQV